MVLISRMPLMAMLRVRGMGVADRVSISTPDEGLLQLFLVLDAEPLLLVDDAPAPGP